MPAIRYRDPRTGQTIPVSAGGPTDHGLMTGLGDDDHPQYLNNTRGDARYLLKTGGVVTGGVNVFATAAARNTAIPSPTEGMMCYLQDTGTTQRHNGFVWVGDTAWTLLTMAAVAAGHTADVPRVRMNYLGGVRMFGMFKASGASIAAYATITTVPTNYRPLTYPVYFVAGSLDAKVFLLSLGNTNGVLSSEFAIATANSFLTMAATWQVDTKAVR